MNVTDYTYLMNKPDAITEKQADALGSVLNEFPYFQSARALRLKGLFNQNSFKYNYALKVTAAHTTDRSVLFDFITSETHTAIQSEYYDQKLRDLLEIKVFDSEIISIEEIKKATEARIDPIEQSILNSIKEATSVTFEAPVKIEEKPIDPIIEESIADNTKETLIASVEEPAKIEEPKTEFVSEKSILDSFTEVTTTFDEPAKIEEPKIELISEQAILDSFKEVTTTFEEPLEIEESKIEIINEEVIFDSFEEVTTTTFEEPVKIDEPKIEALVESEIVVPVKAATFFEETVDEEIPEVRIDPIEESVFNSITEANSVVFEEPKITEEPQIIEQPNNIGFSETVKTAEENLEIGKPLDFSVSEKHSFQEWLQLARTEPIDRSKDALIEIEVTENSIKKKTELEITVLKEEKKTVNIVEKKAEAEIVNEEKKKKAEIINKFIKANPKIPPIKQTAITPAVQLDSNNEENSYLMTETLARVYLEQKKYTKAIQAYEILILKYPEKISFFADRISDIKILQQNNNNN